MPLIESKPDALAQTYARSLFELAEAQGGRARVEECQGELEAVLEAARADARFGEFLSSRVLPPAARAESLTKIFQGRLSETVLRFLLVVNRKGRLGHLPAIVAAYDQTLQERFGRVEVDVFTAAPLSGEELEQVRSRLSAALSKDIVVHPYTDDSLIGGIRLRIGDQLIDGSVSNRLRRMRQRLQNEGVGRMRERMDRMLGEG